MIPRSLFVYALLYGGLVVLAGVSAPRFRNRPLHESGIFIPDAGRAVERCR
jgi:hypothetical protein